MEEGEEVVEGGGVEEEDETCRELKGDDDENENKGEGETLLVTIHREDGRECS